MLAALIDGVEPPEFVGRLSRFEFDGVGAEPVASVGPVRVLASEQLDAEAVAGAARASAARSCGPRSSGASANSATRASSPRRRPRWSRRSAASSSATGPNSPSWLELRPRRLPRLAGADRLAARPGADAQADDGAGPAPAPLRLDPRRRHQRQVLGDADDRGAAGGARRRRRRLPLAAHRALVGADADPRRGDRRGGVGGARSSGSPGPPRASTAASRRATR